MLQTLERAVNEKHVDLDFRGDVAGNRAAKTNAVNAHFASNERASDVSGHVLAISLESLHTEQPAAPLLTAPEPSVVPEHDIDTILDVVLQVL